MAITDAFGIPRVGVFEQIPDPAADAVFEPVAGTAKSIEFRVKGPAATATPEYVGPNIAKPVIQSYEAHTQGAAKPPMSPDSFMMPMMKPRRR